MVVLLNKIAEHCSTTPILEEIIGKKAPSQSALSRFFSKDFDWLYCSIKRLNKNGAITLTHGEMIRGIINAKHRTCLRKNKVQIYFATTCAKFASLFKKFWPNYFNLGFGHSYIQLLD